MTTGVATEPGLALALRFVFDLHGHEPSLSDFGELAADVAGLVGTMDEQSRRSLLTARMDRWSVVTSAAAHRVVVRRFRSESPVDLVLALPAAMTAVPTLGVLIYAAKRAFGLDLEFKAHRERQRIKYLRARHEAQRLMRDDRTLPPGEPERSHLVDVQDATRTLRDSRSLQWQARSGAFTDWDDVDWQ